MKLHLNNAEQSHVIRSCVKKENGFKIKIDDEIYDKSLIVTPEKIQFWGVHEVSTLSLLDINKIAEFPMEVAILGTGMNIQFPPSQILQPLISKGVGLEIMDTAAACRTYSVLRADGRKVVAALIL